MSEAKPIDELVLNLRKINAIAEKKDNSNTPVPDIKNKCSENEKRDGLGIEFAVLMALNLLHDFAGFRATDYLEHKIKHIFRNSSREELKEWIQHMECDPSNSDLIALVEDLCNHETYFFRDVNQLDILAEHILPKIIKEKLHKVDNKIKIWSAACSTGEEAYTLAMLLSDALMDAKIGYSGKPGEIFLPSNWDIEVVGSDISRQALRLADQGSYAVGGLDSFRQYPKQYLKYLENPQALSATAGEQASIFVSINQTIRQLVSFELFNLVEKTPLHTDIDIILCRNTFIYIDPEIQKQILLMIHGSMRPGGYLILSPVDVMPYPELFEEHWIDHCVVYEKKA